MVLAYHIIFGTYGFWLPNDPRGSWSVFVGAWELFRFGRATKTTERRSLAYQPHDHAGRRAAKEALKWPPVKFTGIQARAVGRGFAESAKRGGVIVWECSILPDHVHLVLGRHSSKIETVVSCFKGAATHRLLEEGIHPFQAERRPNGLAPHCWAQGQWKVFLDSAAEVRRSVDYVEDNPEKEGLPRQRWSFVTPFKG
jgi:REP element-mobilizing transposase RayT